MKSENLSDAAFETMLRLAVVENFEEEMADIPPKEELEKQYSFSERHMRRMKKLFMRERRARVFAAIGQVGYKVAAVLVVAVSLLFAMLLINPNVKVAVGKTFVEWFSSFTRFSFHSDNVSERRVEDWQPAYLPFGFEEVNKFAGAVMGVTEYSNGVERVIFICAPTESSSLNVDNQNNEYKLVLQDGIEYHLFISITGETFSSAVWEKDGFLFSIQSTLGEDELLKMAASVYAVTSQK